MNWLPLWIACGLLTFAIRFSFIGLEGRFRPPAWFVRWLPFVPIAALTALIVPELALASGKLQPFSDRMLAGAIAICAAWRWRNTLLTIGSGFVALWLVRWLSGLQ